MYLFSLSFVRRRMQRFCLLLIPLASLPTLATAHADNLPPAARDSNLPLNKLLQLRDSLPRKRLKVARIVPPDRPMESAGNQVLKAISDQYLQLIGEQLDLHFENVELPSPQAAVDALLEQRIDLLPRASDFEAANPELRLSLPYLRNQPIIVGRSSDRSLPLDLRGKQVLVLKNYLDSNRVRKAYPLSILREVSTTALAFEQLARGEADAFIGDQFRSGLYLQARTDLALHNKFSAQLPDTGFAFAVRRDELTLLTLLNHALQSIPEAQKLKLQQQASHGPFPYSPIDTFMLSPQELGWLQDHGQINLLAHETPPYLYRTSDGRWSGRSVDLLQTLADAFRLELNIESSQSRSHDLEQLARGHVDLASRPLAIADGSRGIRFSQPYVTRNWAFIIRNGDSSPSSLEAMEGHTLSLPRQHPLLEHLRLRYPQIQLMLTDNFQQALDLVRLRRADATLDSPASDPMQPGPGLQYGLSIKATPSPHQFAVAQGSGELLGILDKLLDSLSRAPLSDIQVVAERPRENFWEWAAEQAWHVGVGALVIFALFLVWNWRLKIQVKERICAQTRLQDKLAFQFSLLNGLPTPLYVCDLHGRLSTCNRAYEEFFSTSQEQVEGCLPTEQLNMPAEFAQVLQDEHQQLLHNHRPRFLDTSLVIKGEQHYLYQWLVPFYSARGLLQGLLGGWLDISERKHLEIKLREAKQVALKASAAKSEFLASMSHELRTPLNALVGLLELETSSRTLPSHNLRVAQQSATSMIDLIGNILDLDKIESGLMQLAAHPTALEPLLTNSLGLFAAQAREKNLQLHFDYHADRQRLYWVDSLRVQQIFHNLISNALKFTDQGGIHVRVSESVLREGVSLLTLSVSDTGIGIPLALQPLIFEPYRQASARTAHLYGGSGLGLSICNQLTQLMDGHIWLESQPGQGCCVSVELPLSWQLAPGPVDEPLLPDQQEAKALRVLVVDDVSTNGLVLTLQLGRLGHQAEHVCSGEQALLALSESTYDVLISDCNMPGMDGYALARTVRQDERRLGLPQRLIIGYTASALSNEATQCSNAGMNDLMIKPVTLARLQEVLNNYAPVEEEPRDIRAFSLDHLDEAGRNSSILRRRILLELTKNLQQEIQQIRDTDLAAMTETIGDLSHRLTGVACLIDASEMAAACQALRQVNVRQPQAVRRCQADLLHSMERIFEQAKADLAALRQPLRPWSRGIARAPLTDSRTCPM
ncbi:ATP-binding protein [Pseudomonas protegens]|uniref:ATP-binding protein n=2 Tax=Pseudomonas protegens TaxID=380021 RepID=UPI0015772188|nr:transporter substrate-binding domain-containing protein [Pseudomonas protegens]MBP5103761.1 transporter substrate-binding domain-containing protein [Pseudomonas protegens]MBP5148914.1 transporter substrate-binding domain-containing protein [Pseudomonas protegens]NTZ74467.1 transporter substrate-binding domain-containing protein [Pseudomonas protegens]UVL70370.1 transporter substrate-binding domain-containing protein [Pseudomonas protegens]